MNDEEKFNVMLEWASKAVIAIVWAVVAILVFAAFSTAFGQPMRRCGDRTAMADYLARTFKEYPVQSGVGYRGEATELYQSSTGSWTLTLELPDGQGMVCVLTAGTNWTTTPRGARCAGGC